MRKTFYTYLISLLAFSFASANEIGLTVDSIQQLIQNENTPEAKRVDLLNTLSELMMFESLSESKFYCENAIKRAINLHYSNGEAKAYLLMSRIQLLEGDMEMALKFGKKSLKVYQGLGEVISLIAAHTTLGNILSGQTEFEDAFLHFRQAKIYALKEKDKIRIADIDRHLGAVFQNVGNLDSAKWYYENSLQTANQISSLQLSLAAANDLAALYQSKGLYLKALYYFEEALTQSVIIGDLRNQSIILNNLGENYRLSGNHDLGVQSFFESLEIKQQLEDKNGVANVLNNIALCFKSQGDLEAALRYFKKCYSLKKELKDQSGLPVVLANIACIEMEQNNIEDALQLLAESISLAKENSALIELAWLYNLKGKIFYRRKDFDEALEYFKKGLEFAVDFEQKEDKIQSQIGIAKIYAEKNNYSESRILLLDCLESLKALRALGLQLETLSLLAENYSQSGYFKLAYQTLEEVRNLEKEILQNEKKAKTEQLLIQFESEQKEKENQFLKDEQLQKEELIKLQKRSNAILIGMVLFLILLILVGCGFYYSKRKSNLLLAQKNENLKEQSDLISKKNLALEKAQTHLQLQTVELQKASENKNDFLANISHELRTPLNSILLLSKILSKNSPKNLIESQLRAATVIHQSGQRLLDLVNDILDLSKMESGLWQIKLEDFEISEIKEELEGLFEQYAHKKGITLSIKIDENLPRKIKFDQIRLGQILKNLISNAIKFTPENGEVKLNIYPGKNVELSETKAVEKQWICFEVEDNGRGIEADQFHSIFEPFNQGDTVNHRNNQGTGLGLAIVKKIVVAFDGEIKLESQPGLGSRFSVLLPIEAVKVPTSDLVSI